MAGDASTVRMAVLLAEPADGVCVLVTPHVVFGFPPTVLLVTLKVTVQLLLAGIVIPVKLRAVAPAIKEEGVVPVQVPPTAPPTALMLDRVSVNATPVRMEALLFDNVRFFFNDPATSETFALSLHVALRIGEASTVRVAVLLAEPADGVC